MNPILRLREAAEESAKTALLEKQAELLEVDATIESLIKSQYDLAQEEAHTVAARVELAARFEILDNQIRDAKALRSAIDVEAETLRRQWIEARKEAETLRKLRDKDYL